MTTLLGGRVSRRSHEVGGPSAPERGARMWLTFGRLRPGVSRRGGFLECHFFLEASGGGELVEVRSVEEGSLRKEM